MMPSPILNWEWRHTATEICPGQLPTSIWQFSSIRTLKTPISIKALLGIGWAISTTLSPMWPGRYVLKNLTELQLHHFPERRPYLIKNLVCAARNSRRRDRSEDYDPACSNIGDIQIEVCDGVRDYPTCVACTVPDLIPRIGMYGDVIQRRNDVIVDVLSNKRTES